MARADVDLKVYGPELNDSIILCPDDDYLLVFECVTTESSDLLWELRPLVTAFSFTETNTVGEDRRPRFTVILTEKATDMFRSQLQVSTTVLIEQMIQNNGKLEVSCETLVESKKKDLLLSGICIIFTHVAMVIFCFRLRHGFCESHMSPQSI